MDASGRNLFFTTADQLLALDGDTQEDVYDARVEGGFPTPQPVSCEGDGCQGASAAGPSFATAGSASQPAGENLPVPVEAPAAKATVKPRKTGKCAKGRKLKHGRCVKAKHASTGHAKTSGRDRKAGR
jgi:hypothetical protein